MGMDEEEKEELQNNPLSKTIFLDKDHELLRLTRVFMQIPFEHSPMGGAVAKKYDAIKDYLSWNDFELKKWVPIVVNMGNIWASEAKNK